MYHKNSIWLNAFGIYELALERNWSVNEDGSVQSTKGKLHVSPNNELLLDEMVLLERQGNIAKQDIPLVKNLVVAAYEEVQ